MIRHPIRQMPPELALKIAAGEVVERPASVVKELIDNAIDAGAQAIAVEVREAGLKSIRLTDDGCGIPREELLLAFTSHATSKVRQVDDLERITTLGFRGEALAAIAAVSRVEVQSRAKEEQTGSAARLEFGVPVDNSSHAVAGGLRITVADLFANVPARRKFVRSLRAEGGQITSVVLQYALAQPGIRFTLTLDGRLTFHSPGSGRLTDAFAAVYGPQAATECIAVEAEETGVEVSGILGRPSLNRPTRSAIHLFVNGRPAANRSLIFALEEAYSGFLMTARHPMAAVHLRIPVAEVDPNIHPAKSEVRFAREREVHGALYRAVAAALLDMRLSERGMELQPEFEEPSVSEEQALPLSAESNGHPTAETQLLPNVPALRVFGQTKAAFIIAEGPRGLYMIDQHAAHERILFDQFDTQLDQGFIAAQPLLEPETVELEPAQISALEGNAGLLTQAGFVLEPFGEGACLVRAIPALSGRSSPTQLVREVLDELQNLPEPHAARERALAAMACRAAVKAGQILDVHEMRELVEQLEQTLRPNTCPHGRPTMIHLSHLQLEREFGRR
ncbi:MAG: DNA mismatch repair endonuclease MutL [Chloroflexota bacterium]